MTPSFAADVRHLLANARLALGLSGDEGLTAEEVHRLNATLRAFSEDRVEPELARVAPPGFPIIVGLGESEATGLAEMLERTGSTSHDGLLIFSSPECKALQRAIAQRIREAGVDLLAEKLAADAAGRAVPARGADAALENDQEAA